MKTFKRRADFLERQVGDERMLYDATGRKVHVLNETAYFIWTLCDGTLDTEALFERANAEFEADPTELRADIEACLAEFQSLGLLEDERGSDQ